MLETVKKPGHDLGPNLLLTNKDDDLDKLWSGAIKTSCTPVS